jgi:hypothetical protein
MHRFVYWRQGPSDYYDMAHALQAALQAIGHRITH